MCIPIHAALSGCNAVILSCPQPCKLQTCCTRFRFRFTISDLKHVQAPPPPKPVAAAKKLRDKLVAMKQQNPGQDEKLKACWTLLMRYCGNIAQVGWLAG